MLEGDSSFLWCFPMDMPPDMCVRHVQSYPLPATSSGPSYPGLLIADRGPRNKRNSNTNSSRSTSKQPFRIFNGKLTEELAVAPLPPPAIHSQPTTVHHSASSHSAVTSMCFVRGDAVAAGGRPDTAWIGWSTGHISTLETSALSESIAARGGTFCSSSSPAVAPPLCAAWSDVLYSHRAAVSQLRVVRSDHSLLVSCGFDALLLLWDTTTRQQLRVLSNAVKVPHSPLQHALNLRLGGIGAARSLCPMTGLLGATHSGGAHSGVELLFVGHDNLALSVFGDLPRAGGPAASSPNLVAQTVAAPATSSPTSCSVAAYFAGASVLCVGTENGTCFVLSLAPNGNETTTVELVDTISQRLTDITSRAGAVVGANHKGSGGAGQSFAVSVDVSRGRKLFDVVHLQSFVGPDGERGVQDDDDDDGSGNVVQFTFALVAQGMSMITILQVVVGRITHGPGHIHSCKVVGFVPCAKPLVSLRPVMQDAQSTQTLVGADDAGALYVVWNFSSLLQFGGNWTNRPSFSVAGKQTLQQQHHQHLDSSFLHQPTGADASLLTGSHSDAVVAATFAHQQRQRLKQALTLVEDAQRAVVMADEALHVKGNEARELRDTIQELDEALRLRTTELHSAEDRSSSYHTQLQLLRQQLEEREQQNRQLEDQRAQLQSEQDTLRQRYEGQVQQSKEGLDAFTSQSAKLRDAALLIKALEAELTASNVNHEIAQAAIAELQKGKLDHDKLRVEHRHLQKRLSTLNELVDEQQEVVKELRSRNLQLSTSVAAVTARADAAESELEGLKTKHQNLRAILATLNGPSMTDEPPPAANTLSRPSAAPSNSVGPTNLKAYYQKDKDSAANAPSMAVASHQQLPTTTTAAPSSSLEQLMRLVPNAVRPRPLVSSHSEENEGPLAMQQVSFPTPLHDSPPPPPTATNLLHFLPPPSRIASASDAAQYHAQSTGQRSSEEIHESNSSARHNNHHSNASSSVPFTSPLRSRVTVSLEPGATQARVLDEDNILNGSL